MLFTKLHEGGPTGLRWPWRAAWFGRAKKRIELKQFPVGDLGSLGPLQSGSMFIVDWQQHRIVHVTEQLLEVLGYTPEAVEVMTSDNLRDAIHPADWELLDEHLAQLSHLKDDETLVVECRIRRADGQWHWIEVRERVRSRTPDGRVQQVIGVARDVDSRRRLREALKAASCALLQSEEKERRRIARELHDATGQLLAGATLILSSVERKLEGDLKASVREARGAISSAQKEVRTLSYLLHPPQLEREGLPATLQGLADGFGRRSGIVVRFVLLGGARVLSPAVELALFRIAQEALMNAHKHAHAQSAEMRLEYKPSVVHLEVEDDGALSAPGGDNAMAPGVGLSSMRARMSQLGGRLVASRRGGGLVIRAIVPTEASAAPSLDAAS